ncbi:hypothetical protein GCM10009021_24000 [Halarchaeum nitratireducens]|uniref:Small CPxCG-related zinc finger protein n=2 Tax=Halarchaeum nitratireducens TaxID=489913 RepID=A0A830GDQ9_9EURY|nr:hypothetical protein GCM10009021_24000 [Halarchaeum nitratireducens]
MTLSAMDITRIDASSALHDPTTVSGAFTARKVARHIGGERLCVGRRYPPAPMAEAEYRVRCPSCAESFAVDAAMRDDLLAAGCVLCGASLSEADFARLSGSSSTS